MTPAAYRILKIYSGLMIILLGGQMAFADSREEYFKQGQQAYDRADYEKAAQLYEKVVELDANYAPVYNALGLTYRSLNGSIDDVTWLFKVATDIDPNYIEAYDNLCKTYYQATQYDEAEKTCLRILSLNPNQGSAQLTLAWVYLGKSQPDKAVYYFEELLKKIQAPGIYYGLGTAYARSGKNAQLLETVTKLRSLGQEQLAAQLEGMIRNNGPTSRPPAPSMDIQERQSGRIVSSREPTPAASEEPAASQPRGGGGTMKIRLKGKLGGGATAKATGTAPTGAPGGMQNSSAIERIKAMQKQRLGAIPSSSGSSGY